ncbi:peptidoglycan-binding protein [Rhodobacterales bacterium HKCCD6035]|nr:peptidoglycan-binding protein [Rhodobacterales bacterium HKCCD6035]
MLSVRAISHQILSHEGGFSDDPDDPGDPTNLGITLAALRNAGRDLDGDGDIDRDDILRLTRAIAVEIFGEDYYRAPRIYFLPGALQSVVYDMQVNAGAQAIILLQRLLRDMGFDRAINGLNRLPRPLMALSVIGLFAFAMIDPVAFSARMTGLASIPEPLWWLLGAVVSFYFGAREMYYSRIPDTPPQRSARRWWPFGQRGSHENPALEEWRAD